MKIYLGNLPKTVKDRDLSQLFEAHGKVVSAAVIRDRQNGESRGFGFVEMASRAEGEHAIAALNETELQGQKLHVNEARERDDRNTQGQRQGRASERLDHQTQSHFRGGWDHGSRGGHTYRGQGGKRGM